MSASTTEQLWELDLFGSSVRLLALDPEAGGLQRAEALLWALQALLTRFDDSELTRLNADPRARVPVSPLLGRALQAAERAWELSGGLVDVTVLPELERAGYRRSRIGAAAADLASALAAAPPRAPGQRRGGGPRLRFDPATGEAVRAPGVRIDLGGVGKGLAADAAAELLAASFWAVDCGGDIRLGGRDPQPRRLGVPSPFSGAVVCEFELASGGVATSGLGKRIWKHGGGFSHHLIDPASGLPAWTGVVQATALAPSALEAETLAKAALLSGPERGLEVLRGAGGALITDDGELLVAEPPANAVDKGRP
jgi:thiamine biosynthesis lipoprotein